MAAKKNLQPMPVVISAPAKPAAPSSLVPAKPATKPAPIENVAAIGPAVEALTTKLAALPQRIPSVVIDMKKTQTEVKTHMDKAMKSAEEIVSFGQGNVEAIMKSSQIWTAGLQDLGKHFAATVQAQMDETMAIVKTLSGVKSLKEAMDIQSTLAKTAMEKMMAETGKMTDASMKLAEQAMAPISARMTLAAEKFTKTA